MSERIYLEAADFYRDVLQTCLKNSLPDLRRAALLAYSRVFYDWAEELAKSNTEYATVRLERLKQLAVESCKLTILDWDKRAG